MKNLTSEASRKSRPLAPIAVLLILATMTHALLVGCGGGGQKNTPETPATDTPDTPIATDSGGVGGEGVAMGAKVYADRCALCHGPEGKGDGPAAAGLNPKPRNHTDGSYMNSRSDEELQTVIRSGKGGMPAWVNVLNEQEIQAVVKHVRSLAK